MIRQRLLAGLALLAVVVPVLLLTRVLAPKVGHAPSAHSVAVVATATIVPARTPLPTPAPTVSPPTLPPLYYRLGNSVLAAAPDGSNPVTVATLPTSTLVVPSLMGDGRLLYPTETGFAAVDRYGRSAGIRIPALAVGEAVWQVAPSPDGRQLAWQIFSPATYAGGAGYTANTGAGRVVVTGRFGDASGTTMLTEKGDSATFGQTQAVLGWRTASPYGSGDATLLLQNLYSASSMSDKVLIGAKRGLIEFDPAIKDIVNDYFPPLQRDVPAQQAFALSPDGVWTVFGDDPNFPPSGESALAGTISVLDLDTNHLVKIDDASTYLHRGEATIRTATRVKGRTVVKTTKAILPLNHYFSHHAAIAPDDGHVLYTTLTVSYPPGATLPAVARAAVVASLDGRTHVTLATDAEGEGWLSPKVAVVKKADGLYSVDLVSGTSVRLVASSNTTLSFIGLRQH